MKTLKLLVALILLHTPLLACADVLAGPITNPANGHIYYLLTQNHWVHSEQEAKSMGGHLVTIDDEAEQLWVFSTFATYGGVYRTLLIALNDIKVEGQFRWASGQPLIYTNWNIGAPNGSTNENAVFMYPACTGGSAGKWDDVGQFGSSAQWCGMEYSPFHGVVEIDPIQMQIQVSQVAISWNSTLDINYQVQYVSSLTSNAWTNLGVPVVGTGSNNIVFDSVLDQPKKFYRVISVP